MKLRAACAAASVLATVAAAVVACGADDNASFYGDSGDASAPDSSGFDPSDRGMIPLGAASGIVILHAAAFPAFRLCFENYPDLAPLPDSTVMPQANVVGVEVGSVVRIPPLERAPGKVYVIDQREVRATPRDPQARKCGALISDRDFTVDRKYHVADAIDAPLGVGHVDVLAITGCGGGSWLQELKIEAKDCTNWDPTKGSLHTRTIALHPTFAATTKLLPVQVVHMSSQLETVRVPGEEIEVSFGELDAGAGAGLAQNVVSAPPLFDASAPTTLHLDQSAESVYGSHGFRIAIRPSSGRADAGAATPSFSIDETLAEVQELSFAQTVPTTYYLAASNYVLLLLGDPRIARTYTDGGTNPDYDPRRAVHLLAVPVKEEIEAGTEGDASTDSGSVDSTGDGG